MSFPSRERGLKPLEYVSIHILGRSFPSRERGLKPEKEIPKNLRYFVVPLAGTWIETA